MKKWQRCHSQERWGEEERRVYKPPHAGIVGWICLVHYQLVPDGNNEYNTNLHPSSISLHILSIFRARPPLYPVLSSPLFVFFSPPLSSPPLTLWGSITCVSLIFTYLSLCFCICSAHMDVSVDSTPNSTCTCILEVRWEVRGERWEVRGERWGEKGCHLRRWRMRNNDKVEMKEKEDTYSPCYPTHVGVVQFTIQS